MFDLVTECFICQKRTSVLQHALIGGVIVEVCEECLKYGEKIEVTEVDDLVRHSSLVGVLKFGKDRR